MDEIKKIVKYSVNEFLKEIPNLLDLDVHEQAISHRIAFYIESLLSKSKYRRLNVDCEYNKNQDQPKTIDLPGEPIDYCNCKFCEQNVRKNKKDKKLFRPDIIVHKRKNENHNMIAIELKKSNVCYFDLEKLKILTKNKINRGYGYKVGVFIYFLDKKPIYKWFLKGEEI